MQNGVFVCKILADSGGVCKCVQNVCNVYALFAAVCKVNFSAKRLQISKISKCVQVCASVCSDLGLACNLYVKKWCSG